MKKKIVTFTLLLLCMVTLFAAAMPVSALEPYTTYTYSPDGFALKSPAAYSPTMSVDYKAVGLETKWDDAADIFVDDEDKVYLVDTANNRIIVMTPFYKLDFIIDIFVNSQGVHDSFDKPGGVFVNEENIYVCDTNNSRIVMFDREGNFEKTIEKPESALFGEDSIYQPVAMSVDQYGRIYVVSQTTNQGVIVMDENGTFNGFIGAQAVNYNILDIIWRRFQSKEQRKKTSSYIPVSFNNISIDEEGFIFVTNDSIDETSQLGSIKSKSAAYSPVKKLNSAGDEIMKRNGFFDPGGEVDIKPRRDSNPHTGVSRISDVAIGPEGTWSIVDPNRCKVFTYDSNGNMLFTFGDEGEQLGNIRKGGSLAYQGNYLLLLDVDNDTFTVYERTEYGDLLIEALACENDRRYGDAIDCWKSVLQRNNNFDTAYIGIGKALYRESDYEGAMEYLHAAYETTYYSKSYQELRKVWIADFFVLIPIVVIVLCVAWSFFMKYVKRVNYETAHSHGKRTYWQELLYSFHLVFHPFDGFWDLKHEKRGSLRAALTILLIVIVAFFYQAVGTGYLMNPEENYSTILVQVAAVTVPLLLWSISNWCLTTLFDGEGSLKDIIIACCYALAPMPLFLIISTLLSNVVALEEAQIVSLLVTVSFVWAAFLLFFGMMVTHDYSLFKTITTTIGTVVAMAVIMFVAVLFTSLLGKILSFITQIYTELSYRV